MLVQYAIEQIMLMLVKYAIERIRATHPIVRPLGNCSTTSQDLHTGALTFAPKIQRIRDMDENCKSF